MRTGTLRQLFAYSVAVTLGVWGAAGCSSAGGSSGSSDTITLYNGQHEEVTRALVAAFQKKTGVHVQLRSGEGPELANQILAEGAASPADVIFTENSPEITLLASNGRLANVDAATLAKVPSRYSSPQGQWVGFAARETALAYNPRLVPDSELPRSALDLAQPAWRGKVGIAPAEGDFQPLVTAIRLSRGESAAKQWVAGLKRNAQAFHNNTAILEAVNAGQVAVGVVNHHYWFRLRDQKGANAVRVRLHYFGHQDPGALVNVSGAGVLSSSRHQPAAQRFLAFLVAPEGQRIIVSSRDYEYPIGPGVQADPQLKPFDTLDPPPIGVAQLGDGRQTVELMQEAGLL